MHLIHSSIYRVLTWIAIVILAVGLCYELWQLDWSGVLVTTAFLTATLMFVFRNDRLPSVFSFLFATASLINAAGWVFNIYRIPFYAPFAHFFTSFTAALAIGFFAYHNVQVHFQKHGWLFALSIAAIGLSFGALWEIIEWHLIDISAQEIIYDLIVDSAGALLAGFLSVWLIRK